MEFFELVNHRYSLRQYKSQKVDRNLLIELLDIARMAPSAVNFQPWQFIIVDDSLVLKAIHKMYPRPWFESAPAVIVALGDHNKAWHRKNDGKDFMDIDLAIVIDHFTLAATSKGLGTCWVCNFDAEQCCNYFNLPDHLEPVALIPVGYPSDTVIPEKKRNPLDEMIYWNGFRPGAL